MLHWGFFLTELNVQVTYGLRLPIHCDVAFVRRLSRERWPVAMWRHWSRRRRSSSICSPSSCPLCRSSIFDGVRSVRCSTSENGQCFISSLHPRIVSHSHSLITRLFYSENNRSLALPRRRRHGVAAEEAETMELWLALFDLSPAHDIQRKWQRLVAVTTFFLTVIFCHLGTILNDLSSISVFNVLWILEAVAGNYEPVRLDEPARAESRETGRQSSVNDPSSENNVIDL